MTTSVSDNQPWYGRIRRRSRALAGFALVRMLAPFVRRLTDTKYFYAFERRGVHVTPIHFYQPVPDTRAMGDPAGESDRDPPGIDFRADRQRKLLKLLAARYKKVYEAFPRTDSGADFFLENGAFGTVDAEILHSMVRYLRPRRIIEVGSGFSTLVMAGAIKANKERNHRYSCRLTCIDPYPSPLLKGLGELSKITRGSVQGVPLSEFEKLQSGDILFIDSSHVLAVGSDVRYELLEILPRLRKGVYVHFHDVFLPSDYPSDWPREKAIFWNEQYGIQSFLQFNSAFEVIWAGAFMSIRHPKELKKAIGSFYPGGPRPASLWIRRVR